MYTNIYFKKWNLSVYKASCIWYFLKCYVYFIDILSNNWLDWIFFSVKDLILACIHKCFLSTFNSAFKPNVYPVYVNELYHKLCTIKALLWWTDLITFCFVFESPKAGGGGGGGGQGGKKGKERGTKEKKKKVTNSNILR